MAQSRLTIEQEAGKKVNKLLEKQPTVQKESADAAMQSILTQYDNSEIARKLVIDVLRCRNCDLYIQCNGPVPGVGPVKSPLMFVGEAPANFENDLCIPLVGESGVYFTMVLDYLGVDRSKVRISNVVKCRMPNNKSPEPAEYDTCGASHLANEIGIVAPQVLVTMGNPANKFIFGDHHLKITHIWGEFVPKEFVAGQTTWIMPTVHPQYVIKQKGDDYKEAKKQFVKHVKMAIEKCKELAPDYQLK